MSNVSFQVARMEQELFYLNGFRAGVEGTELPPGSADEFARGYGAGSVERAAKERARALSLHLSGLREGLTGADVSDTPTCAELDAGRDEGLKLRAEILASASAPAKPSPPKDGVTLDPCFNCKVPLWIDTESDLIVDEHGPHSCKPSPSETTDKWGSTETTRFRVESKEWLPVIKHRVDLPVAAEVSVGAHGSLDGFEGDLAVMVDGVVSEMSERRRYTKERSGFKLGGVATLLAGDHDIALVARGAGVVGNRTVYVEVRSVLSKPPEPLTDAEIVALRKLIGGV